MPWGGRRPGAGRPRGLANKLTREAAETFSASDLSPMRYLRDLMADPEAEPERRDWAAAQLMPFMHPRLGNLIPDQPRPETGPRRVEIVLVAPAPAASRVIEHNEAS